MASETTTSEQPATTKPAILMVDGKTAAAMCSVSSATWARWTSAGKNPEPKRVGSQIVRWLVAELRAWCEAGCPNRKTWAELREGLAADSQRSPTPPRRTGRRRRESPRIADEEPP